MTSSENLQSLQALARDAARKNQWELALQHWNELLKKFPLHLPGYVGKVNVLIALDRLDEAEHVSQQTIDNFPDRSQGWHGLIRIALRRQQWEQVQTLSAVMIENFPDQVQGYQWQGLAYIELNQFEQAEATFTRLTELNADRVQGFRGLARVSLKSKQWKQTIDRCNRLIENFPDHIQGYIWKANALMLLEKFDQAETLFKQATERFPNSEQGYQGLIQTAMRSQQWKSALDRCEHLLKTVPGNLQGCIYKGKILTALGQFEKAEVYYRGLIDQSSIAQIGLQGLAQIMMAKDEWNLAIEYWDRLIVEHPDELQGYLGKSSALRQLNELEEAIAICEQALNVHPDHARIYEMMGDIYTSQTLDGETSFSYYQKGLQKNPDDYSLHLKVAHSLSNKREFEGAIGVLEKAIQLSPHLPAAYNALSFAQCRVGKVSDALKTLQRCVQTNKHSSQAYKNLAHFQWVHLKDVAKAWRHLETARKINGASIAVLLAQANLLLDIGRFKAARQLFAEIVQQFSHNPEGHIGLALADFRTQGYEQLRRDWQSISQRFPQVTLRANQEQARCLIKLNRLDEAETIYKELCEQFPGKSEGLVGLALVAEQKLQWDKARKRWKEVIQRFPTQIFAYHRYTSIFIELGDYKAAKAVLEPLFEVLPVAYLWCVRLHMRNGQIQTALSYCKLAMDKGFFAEAAGAMTIIALRLGEENELEIVSNLFWTRRLAWCCQETFELLTATLDTLQAGQFRKAWTTYLLAFRNEYEYGVKASSKLQSKYFIFAFSIIEFAKPIIEKRDENQLEVILDYICENQEVFECQADLLAYIHFLYSLSLEAQGNNLLALKRARYSLSLNPDNPHCLSLIERILKVQYKISTTEASITSGHIALIVITCQKYADKIPLLEDCLYQEMGLPHYYVIGDPTLDSDWRLDDCTLYVKAPDNYESLSIKVLKALEFFHCCTDYKGVIKIDDDCWIKDIQTFRSVVMDLENNCHSDYIGRINSISLGRTWHFGKCQLSKLNDEPYALTNETHYCAGGFGYYLSRRSLKLLFEHSYKYPSIFEHELYEDVLIGKVLSYYNIKPQPFSLLDFELLETNYDIRTRSLDIQDIYSQATQCVEAKQFEAAANLYSKLFKIDEDQPLHYYTELLCLHKLLKDEPSSAVLSALIRRRFPDCDLDSSLSEVNKKYQSLMSDQVSAIAHLNAH